MKISEVISQIKKYHKDWESINEETTRDKVLFGDPSKECTGIVTTCWASAEVIRKAHEAGANLIICHEALFWNHGDKTDWLNDQRNKVFLEKKELLESTGIVVWRNHDHIHSGIPIGNGEYVDGIFYAFAKEMGWDQYIVKGNEKMYPTTFEIPETSVENIGKQMLQTFNLNGMKVIGDINAKVSKVFICAHIMGKDNDLITKVDKENIDLLISLELIDYTVSEYIHDSSIFGENKAIVTVGHFNAEEPGMKYMTQYLESAIGSKIPSQFIQSGDMYQYIV